MRILAIRGKNLASLADEFAISLHTGVLQNAGLFAITGQTGAGKSTLLDALCLALYDKIPRLPDGLGVAIGHVDEDDSQRVKSNDVRSILRRGSAQGYAEVDFIGKDKQSYRARWQVSKTRGKASGKLQSQEMSLTCLATGRRIGQTKKSVLEATSDLIGLNFEQFRRSVLLAQGDFAAFLKAKKDERSSLLERITGTELYSELSIAAFNRAKNEDVELKRLQQLLQDQIPLSLVERQNLMQQRDALIAQLKILEQQRASNQSDIAYYVELRKKQQAEELARTAVAQCQQAWLATENTRRQLQQLATALPLKPLLTQYEQAQIDVAQAECQVKNSADVQMAAASTLQLASQQLTTRCEELLDAEQQQQNAQPVLKAIRVLDTRLDVLHNNLNNVNTETTQLHSALITTQTQYDSLQKQHTAHSDKLQQLSQWLEKNQALQGIASEWTHWESELHRYQQLQQQRNAADHQLAHSEATANAAQQGLQTLQIAIDASKQRLQQQQNELTTLNAQQSQLSLSDLYAAKEKVESEREQLNRALTLAKQAGDYQQTLSDSKESLASSERNLAHASGQRDLLEKQQLLNSGALIEARRVLASFEATTHKDVVQLRQTLIEQEPCPVCGATQHPWQDTDNIPIGNEHIQAQNQRVSKLENEKATLIKQLADCLKTSEQEQKSSAELQKKVDATQDKLQQLADDWLALTLPELFKWTDTQLIERLSNAYQQSNALWLELKAQEKTALALQQQISALQTVCTASQEKTAVLINDYAALDKQQAKNKAEWQANLSQIATLTSQLNASKLSLAVPFHDFPHWLQSDEQLPIATIQTQVQQFQQAQQNRQTVSSTLETCQHELQLAKQQREQCAQQLSNKQAELQREQEQQQTLISERQNLLGQHSSADALEQRLQQQFNTARIAQQQATDAVNVANNAASTSTAQTLHWREESNRCQQRLTVAQSALQTALEKHALTLEQLTVLVQHDENTLIAQKADLAKIEQALQAATTLLQIKSDERQQQENLAVAVTEAVALETATALQQRSEQLSEQKQELELQLREVDKKTATSSELRAELDKQQQRWQQWQSLNELIGSSTGTKFRVFAQSLTLEALLTHSNRHLADFAKRYCLQRVPNSDLELQIIDRDMADDVRSVHSLSGGESFLVSLALALGLASLSSNKTQVESLFIDEGFGSLDPETLDIAIASLDSLQALGRKVGIISHVPILVERIGAKVIVEKRGGGRSTVTTVAG